MIISTAQKKLWLNRIAVESNHLATFLMDQNCLPNFVVWASIHPKYAKREIKPTCEYAWSSKK